MPTFSQQHPKVAALALVIQEEYYGPTRYFLRSRETVSERQYDWFKYSFDDNAEYETREQAENIAQKFCPIKHCKENDYLDYAIYRIDGCGQVSSI